ncbi:MAG: hypothetical protein WCK49_00420 [Myxococcaceae bacterium]
MPVTPVSTGATQATKLLQEMQKHVKPGAPSGPAFGKVLQQNAHQTQAANQINPTNKIELNKTQKTPSALKSLFNTWSKDQNSMQKIMKVAMSGQNFNPSQLIMLQQATYKVTFELETMSKLVEQASSAVKTTMQTQV